MNTRLRAVLALLALAVPSLVYAQPEYVWKPVSFRTTVTSSTTPTYASYVPGGAATNPGKFMVDTTSFSTGPDNSIIARTDTSAAFTLPGLVIPETWAPRDTVNGTSGTTGVSTTGARQVFLQADTLYCFTVAIGPEVSVEQTGEAADSMIVFLEGSVDGQAWVSLTNAPGHGVAEAGTSNSMFYSWFTAGKVRPATGAAFNIFTWPLLRIRVANTNVNLGRFIARIGYFAQGLGRGDTGLRTY